VLLSYCLSSPIQKLTHSKMRTAFRENMAVATIPFNPDVLALFRLAYPSRAGTEIESAELPYPVSFKLTTRARRRR